jgi:hypothetical protein
MNKGTHKVIRDKRKHPSGLGRREKIEMQRSQKHCISHRLDLGTEVSRESTTASEKPTE